MYQALSLRHLASYPRSAGVARLASAARHVARRCSSQNRSRTARLQPGNRQRVLIAEGILSRLLGCVLSGYRTRRERTNKKSHAAIAALPGFVLLVSPAEIDR